MSRKLRACNANPRQIRADGIDHIRLRQPVLTSMDGENDGLWLHRLHQIDSELHPVVRPGVAPMVWVDEHARVGEFLLPPKQKCTLALRHPLA